MYQFQKIIIKFKSTYSFYIMKNCKLTYVLVILSLIENSCVSCCRINYLTIHYY